MEKKYIIWYRVDGEEDYIIITAIDEDEARRRFYGWHDGCITDLHEMQESESYLAYI